MQIQAATKQVPKNTKKIIQTVPTIKVPTIMSDFPAALAPFYIAVPFVKA